MGNWTVIVPEAGTNLILNGSFEYDAIGASAFTNWAKIGGGETLLVDTAYAVKGIRSGKVTTAVALDGIKQDITANTAASTQYTFSFYARGAGSWLVDVIDGGDHYSSAIVLTTTWTRYTFTFTLGVGATRTLYLYLNEAAVRTAWFDGLQLEQKAYVTTYIDGDQPGCRWNGLAHTSTSTRDAQYRGGGKEVDLESTYNVRVVSISGFGMPPLQNNLQPMSLQPGAVWQSYKILPRSLVLLTNTKTDINSTQATFHQRRGNLMKVFAPDTYRGGQPIRIGYTGASATRTIYGDYRLDGGFEGAALTSKNESIAARLIAVDPLLYEDTQEVAALGFTTSLASNNRAAARINGAWQNLGTGFDGTVTCVTYDPMTSRVYFGGAFVTANGVTVNSVCYWDGTTFVAMGSGVTKGVAGGSMWCITIAPNGDVWAGGQFTSAGGSTADGLAKWTPSTNAWTCFVNGTPGDIITSIAIDKNGLVYGGGVFLNWDGNANEDNIWSYNGSAFAPLSTGTNGQVSSLAIGADGTTLYVGGTFTTPQTRLMSWNGSAFSAMGSGASGNVATIAVADNGDVYVGGSFSTTPTTSYIAKWNGYAWAALGSGLNNGVLRIVLTSDGMLIASGAFTVAGGISVANRVAGWNGSSWYALDASLPGSPNVFAGVSNSGNVFLGYDTTGTALVSSTTTVTPSSSSQTYPIITITGPTTAGTSCTLQWIENQSTNHKLYFNLVILAGVTVVIDLSPGAKTVSSTFSGGINYNNPSKSAPVLGAIGRIYGQPLSNSDRDAFCLLPGANTIACFISGTTTGVTAIMSWRPTHWGVDGVA